MREILFLNSHRNISTADHRLRLLNNPDGVMPPIVSGEGRFPDELAMEFFDEQAAMSHAIYGSGSHINASRDASGVISLPFKYSSTVIDAVEILILSLASGGDNVIELYVVISSSTCDVRIPDPFLGGVTVASFGLPPNTVFALAVEWYFHPTSGYIRVYNGDSLVASYSGYTGHGPVYTSVNPRFGAPIRADFGVGQHEMWIGEYYVVRGDTTLPVRYDKEVRVNYLQPAGNGTYGDSSQTGGLTRLESIQELIGDEATAYNTLGTGQKDTFDFDIDALEIEDFVQGLQVVIRARGAASSIDPYFIINGTEYTNDAVNNVIGTISTVAAWSTYSWPLTTNPDTGADFTLADLQATGFEIGYRCVTGSVDVTQLGIEILSGQVYPAPTMMHMKTLD